MSSPAPPPFWWVEPLILSAGIIVSFGLAMWTIVENRKIARLKATLDLIEASESDPYYRDLYIKFRNYRRDPDYRTKILNPQSDADLDERYACWSYLNHFELIAISISKGVIDEDFYRNWMGYAVIRDFNAAKSLIDIARIPVAPGSQGDIAAYEYLQKLSTRWTNPEKLFFRPVPQGSV